MTSTVAPDDVDRQLPAGDEIFLDHIAHFVRNADTASHALTRCGFSPTPVSIQAHPDGSGGSYPIGTANVTAMFARGYIEFLFKTADTPLTAEFDAMLDRRAGLHLAAFTVADVQGAPARLTAAGLAAHAPVRMQRQVDGATGPQTAAFTIVRAKLGVMPEGRIQMLTHHTEQAVWQPRWLSHPNSATALIDIMIAVADVEEAARRFTRFTGRPATPRPGGGALIRLDRGGIYFLTHDRATERLPEVAITSLPFIVGYAVKVQSLAAAEKAVDQAGLEWHAFEDGIAAAFPVELGEGAWLFVERASGLPWRR